MLDLSDLYQFVTYADCGTLSAAADKLHISQPTLTRTMHDVEDAFGVPLFHRGKNRIELTDTGEVAVEQARSLLSEAEKAVETVQTFERNQQALRQNGRIILNAISIRLPFIPVLPYLYGHYCLNCHADSLIILFPQN